MRKLLFITLATVLLAACEKDETLPQQDNAPATIRLNIGQQESRNTRANNAMGPERENLIYDIWLLQYNAYGELTSATGVDSRQHLRVNEAGVMEVLDLEVTLRALDDATVCLVANLGDQPLENNASWPDNLEAFKRLSIPIDFLTDDSNDSRYGHVNNIALFGYYKGAVKDNMTMNVSLGRLITRVRLNVKPNVAMTGPVELKLENVRSRINIFPTDTPYQPQGATEQEQADDRARNYTTFTKTLPNLGTAGIVQYFYMAENINPSVTDATRFVVSYDGTTYTTYLGTESPSAGNPTERNLSLERNSGYNFGINLRVRHYQPLPYRAEGWNVLAKTGLTYTPNLLDGSVTSYMNIAYNTTRDFVIDMKKEQKFSTIQFYYSTTASTRPRRVTLSGSVDNVTFTPLETVDLTSAGSSVIDLSKTYEGYRYLKIYIDERGTSATQRFSEIILGDYVY